MLKTFLPPQWFAARRRTMLLMYKAPGQNRVEPLAVARYEVGKSFQKAWNPEEEPDLKMGEEEVPAYLNQAFSVGNRLQEILTSQFEIGRTGNEILRTKA